MKAYDSYKDSEVEWIGEIPSHWRKSRFKFVSDLFTGNSLNDSQKLKYESDNQNDIPYVSSKDIDINLQTVNYNSGLRIPKNEGLFRVSAKGSFLMVIEGGSAGKKMVLLEQDVCFVNKLCSFSSVENTKFQYYFIQSSNYQDKFRLSLTGLIGGVSISTLKNFEVILPPLSEQQQIVSFLDTKTSLIDSLIEKTKQKIELLREKRATLINEAVTKGLNPDAEMKDSSVEWIGEIPSDWTFSNFRYCIDVLTDFTANGSFASLAENVDYLDSGFSRLVRLTDLRNNLNNDGIYVSEKAHKFLSKSELKGGELLIANVGAYAGLVTLMPRLKGFFTLGPNMFLLKLNQNHKYFSYLLSSSICAEQLKIMAVSSAQPKLNKDNIRELKVVYPSLAEQEVIVSYLNEETQKIDSRIFKEEKRIDLLKEYRQSLISSVVTGKIKVTEDA